MATIVTIQRVDGQNLFFTDNSTDLLIQGVMYRAAATITLSAVQSLADLKERNLEITGASVASFISEEDIYAGLYREGQVTIRKVDNRYPEFGFVREDLFEIDRVASFDAESFEVELSSAARKLRQRVGGFTSRTCDTVYGGPKCQFDLSQTGARYFGVDVVAVGSDDRRVFRGSTDIVALSTFGDRTFQDGKVTWRSGANVGTKPGIIKRFDVSGNPREITLHQRTKFPVEIGDLFDIESGCQFTTDACDARSNRVNYQGEEFIPSANNNLGGF